VETTETHWSIFLVLAAFLCLVFGWLVLRSYLNAYLATNHPAVLSRIGPTFRNEIHLLLRIRRGIDWFKFLVFLRFKALGDPKLNRICYSVLFLQCLLLVLAAAPLLLEQL